MDTHNRIALSWNLLKYSYGIVLIVIGLDKVFSTNLIVDWPIYISPAALALLPVSVPVFLFAIGLIEIAVAILMLSRWTRLAAHISVAWLILIAINLLLAGSIDIAARDLLLAVGAYVLAELTTAVKVSRNA